MPYEEQYSLDKRNQKRRREGRYSGATQREGLGSVERELDRLFKDFGESSRPVRSLGSRQYGSALTGYENEVLDGDQFDEDSK